MTSDISYIPVRIGTLRPDDVINFDIYIQVGGRYLHYIKNSDPFDGERIVRLKVKGVRKLFIPEEHENFYLQYLDKGLDRLVDKKINVEVKANLVKDAMVTDAENAIRNSQTKEGYEHTEQRMSKIVGYLTSEKGFAKNVMHAAGVSQDTFQHSANVATLSLGMASMVGINSPPHLTVLGLACLLHDIGYSRLAFNPRVPKDRLSDEQIKQYHEHPRSGVAMLSDKSYVTKEVLQLIADHEEIGEGIGFPEKKRLSTLNILSQVLNLCNEFDRYSLIKQKSHKEVVKDFFQDRIGCFPLEHMQFMSSVFKT